MSTIDHLHFVTTHITLV